MIATAERRVVSRPASVIGTARPVNWQTLLDIENAVYCHPAIMAIDSAVLATFPRLRESRLLPGDLSGEADLNREEDNMPVMMLVVRALREAAIQGKAQAEV